MATKYYQISLKDTFSDFQDTSGIELYVSENNPKTLNSLIRRLKSYYKDKPDVDPYKMAYGTMPSQAATCPDAKQQYMNGHFCMLINFSYLPIGYIAKNTNFLQFHFHVSLTTTSVSSLLVQTSVI